MKATEASARYAHVLKNDLFTIPSKTINLISWISHDNFCFSLEASLRNSCNIGLSRNMTWTWMRASEPLHHAAASICPQETRTCFKIGQPVLWVSAGFNMGRTWEAQNTDSLRTHVTTWLCISAAVCPWNKANIGALTIRTWFGGP